MATFGENLKNIRQAKKISQGQLAEMTNLHPSHVSRYERDLSTPSIDIVKKFAEALEVSVDALVYGSMEEKAKDGKLDPELLNIFLKTQALTVEDLDCVKRMLNAFIFKTDIQTKLA